MKAATAEAFSVKAGQYIQIIDVDGRQCADFLAFDAVALQAGDEYGLDATTTHTLMGSTAPKPGLLSKYFDARMVPLVEIVSEADMRTSDQAQEYTRELRAILLATGVSDAKMEEGSMRVDANVSVNRAGEPWGTRCEIKNLNSLRSLGRAIDHEVLRQIDLLDGGEKVRQETRHWDEAAGRTGTLRVKEDADDYRYFPEPDLVPVAPSRDDVDALRETLPEPPAARRKRLQASWGFADLEMRDVVNAGLVDLVEETVAAGASPAAARK